MVLSGHVCGSVVVRGNTCAGNGRDGVHVRTAAAPTVVGNTCTVNRRNGVAFTDQSAGTARGNTCTLNGRHGLRVCDDAAPALEENTSEGNAECGILYEEQSSGFGRGNVCRDNRGDGIRLEDAAAPLLAENEARLNDGYGITIADPKSTADVDPNGNVAEGNRQGTILDPRPKKGGSWWGRKVLNATDSPTRSQDLPRLLIACLAVLGTSTAANAIDFDRDVKPIFARHCVSCHGPDKQRSGFRLDRKADALTGGDLGQAIVPGKAADSPLVRYVSGADPDLAMPPDPTKRLTAGRGGDPAGVDRPGGEVAGRRLGDSKPADWWSLKPLTKPTPPTVDRGWVRTPIDAFVLAKLREKGLQPSPEADRRTLIRRLYFDLIGLPPTPEEVEAFVADTSPDAYEKLVDRLLASPHYGERWARHWLDVVHYGETHGYDKDKPRPNAWPYRDYVIRSLQRRQAVRPVRPGAGRRRRAVPRHAWTASRRSGSSPPGRGTSSATPSCRRRRSTARSPGTSTATTWWRTPSARS